MRMADAVESGLNERRQLSRRCKAIDIGGRAGIGSSERHPEGRGLLQVPRGSLIFLENVKQSAIGPRRAEAVGGADSVSDWGKGQSSKWGPDIASLRLALNSTFFWSDEELTELQGGGIWQAHIHFFGKTINYGVTVLDNTLLKVRSCLGPLYRSESTRKMGSIEFQTT